LAALSLRQTTVSPRRATISISPILDAIAASQDPIPLRRNNPDGETFGEES